MGRAAASDDDLMQAAQGGDEASFALLVQRHRDWVRALIQAVVQDGAQAEDLAQEVFCRIHQQIDAYEARGSFVAWLKRIAVNVAKDYLRYHQRTATLSLESLEPASQADSSFDPAEVLASRVLREDVRAAIAALPDEQRLALVMYYFGQMSLEDIAWALKCPTGTAKSRLFHARRRVREILLHRWQTQGAEPE